jgi:hypothetical protein
MSWQAQTFERLRDREWYKLGDLFEAVQAQIPLHTAMRHVMQAHYGRVELPANSEARWRLFLQAIGTIGVESNGNPRRRLYIDCVRMRYVAGRTCDHCAGPVIKAGWQSRTLVACLACEAPAPEVPAPPQIVTVRPSPGWQYRARRALAEYVKTRRVPFLTVSRIMREWDRTMNLTKFLMSRGKQPLSQQEYDHWLSDYVSRHPP